MRVSFLADYTTRETTTTTTTTTTTMDVTSSETCQCTCPSSGQSYGNDIVHVELTSDKLARYDLNMVRIVLSERPEVTIKV